MKHELMRPVRWIHARGRNRTPQHLVAAEGHRPIATRAFCGREIGDGRMAVYNIIGMHARIRQYPRPLITIHPRDDLPFCPRCIRKYERAGKP